MAPSMPSSVKCSVRPVSVSVLKFTGPMRSVWTVLGELPREEARLAALLAADATDHGARERALGRSRRAGHEHVLSRQQGERHLVQDLVTLAEGALQLREELRKAVQREAAPGVASGAA